MSAICLADFGCNLSPIEGKRDADEGQLYRQREKSRVLGYIQYDACDIMDYKRSIVLLFFPFRDEMIDLLDHDKFLIQYDQHEIELLPRKQQDERYVDFEKDVESNRRLWEELSKDENCADVSRAMPSTYDTSDLLALQNNDIKT